MQDTFLTAVLCAVSVYVRLGGTESVMCMNRTDNGDDISLLFFPLGGSVWWGWRFGTARCRGHGRFLLLKILLHRVSLPLEWTLSAQFDQTYCLPLFPSFFFKGYREVFVEKGEREIMYWPKTSVWRKRTGKNRRNRDNDKFTQKCHKIMCETKNVTKMSRKLRNVTKMSYAFVRKMS